MSSVDLAGDAVSIRPLTIADRDACVVVENASFANPDHRATPDKFAYRLTVCPELCLGVFVHAADAESLVPGAASSAESGVLVGHIVATRCTAPVLTDASMGVPEDWRAALTAGPAESPKTESSKSKSTVGHEPGGGTVAVHSLGIVPSVQGRGLGTKLMRAYLERMGQLSSAGAAGGGYSRVDRVALICQDYLVDYYKKLGFVSNGPSAAQFGGGGWFDMYYDIPQS